MTILEGVLPATGLHVEGSQRLVVLVSVEEIEMIVLVGMSRGHEVGVIVGVRRLLHRLSLTSLATCLTSLSGIALPPTYSCRYTPSSSTPILSNLSACQKRESS